MLFYFLETFILHIIFFGLQILDLENSILSVASITSEVADSSLHSHSEADSHSEDVTLADNLDGNFDPSASAPTSVTSTTIQMSSSPPQRSRTTPKQKRLTGKDRYGIILLLAYFFLVHDV